MSSLARSLKALRMGNASFNSPDQPELSISSPVKQFATITVIGRDKTGVIARITNFLFEQKANIEALEEQVTRGQFSMILQASWARTALDKWAVSAGLDKLAAALGMEITIRFTEPKRLQRAAFMVTREAHCLAGLLDAFKSKRLKAEPAIIIGNRSDLKPVAQKYGVPFELVKWDDRNVAEKRSLEILQDHAVDFVVLARFMKILSPNFVWRYKNKIINIHPSMLPSFPGPQPYRQAYEHGVKMIGVTAHFVSMHLDEGPIIAQNGFHLRPSMTLKEIVERGQKLETEVLLKAVKLYLSKKLDVYWGIVKEV